MHRAVFSFGWRRPIGVAVAAITLASTTLVGLAPPAAASAGQPFTNLQPPFTQALFGTTPVFLGGIAFAPNGDVWADQCVFSGSPLHRYARATSTLVHNTTVHPETVVPSNAGCGLVNHPDGHLYSNTGGGVARLDASTGAAIDTAGPAGNALGITVDPQTNAVVYVGADCRFTATCTIERYDPKTGQSSSFAQLNGSQAQFVDGLTFDPTGHFLIMSTRAPAFDLTILDRSGGIVQQVPMSDEPDGISFHGTDPKFVVTNDTDGKMTRFDFPANDLTKPPTLSTFASGGFRGDLSLVGTDGCIYLTQEGTHYLDGTTTSENSVAQICPGFAPSPGVAPPGLVYVAVGDSYSSGEGAPPFEDGSNYPAAVEQQNTYTYGPGNTSCHRSLTNYAKVAAPTLLPGTAPTLVDVTCSGATIRGAAGPAKGPIVPPDPSSGPASQVTQATNRLTNDFGGLRPSDVNLVTATMGGNDAGFGDLIAACLLPNLAKVLFAQYDNAPGEIEWIVSHFGSCENFDSLFFHTGDKIAKLQGLEQAGQASLLGSFPGAEVLQLTYPGIVPTPNDFGGDTCGGLLRSDAKYVRSKVQAIDDAIRKAALTQSDPRFGLVDVQGSFGSNALCPADPSQALANGINQAALVATVSGLLQPGSQSRQLVDNLANAYTNFRNCVITHSVFGIVGELFCKGALDDLKAAVGPLQQFMKDHADQLVASLAPGADEQQKFDDSRLFFHPNVAGFGVMACNLTAVFTGGDQRQCAPSLTGVLTYLFNNVPLDGMTPQPLTPGAPVPFQFNGFDPNAPVAVQVHSTGIDLGTFTPDAHGIIQGTITLPNTLNPGAHQVEFSGTNHLTPRTIDVLVQLPGRPRGGEDYGTWICCFPADSQVDVKLGGLDLGNVPTDESGGVFVTVPLPAPATPGSITITATGTTSGTSHTQTVSPAPRSAAIWARATTAAALTITGSGDTLGWSHSDGGITITGARNSLTGGVEFGSTFSTSGAQTTVNPAPLKVVAGGSPVDVSIAAFRPGGALAAQLGASYHAIPSSACKNGTWSPSLAGIPSGVVYVPCGVSLTGRGTSLTTTIVAEGPVQLDGTAWSLTPALPGLSLASGSTTAGITLSGAGNTISGAVWSAGPLVVRGSQGRYSCGLYADTVNLAASLTTVAQCSTS